MIAFFSLNYICCCYYTAVYIGHKSYKADESKKKGLEATDTVYIKNDDFETNDNVVIEFSKTRKPTYRWQYVSHSGLEDFDFNYDGIEMLDRFKEVERLSLQLCGMTLFNYQIARTMIYLSKR